MEALRMLPLFPESSSPNCTCTFTPKSSPTAHSTYRDLIIGTYFGKGPGVLPYAKTLETVAPNASKVLIVDQKFLDSPVGKTFAKMSCTFGLVNIGSFPYTRDNGPGVFIIPIFEFIWTFQEYFDRIVITDVNDVVFQCDPFQMDYDWEKITITHQTPTIAQDIINYFWVHEVMLWTPKLELNTTLINTGMIAGRTKDLMKLVRFILYGINSPDLPKRYELNDQGIVEFLVATGYMKEAGIELNLKPKNNIGVFQSFGKGHEEVFPGAVSLNEDTVACAYHSYQHFNRDRRAIKKLCKFDQKDDILFRRREIPEME